MCQFSSISFCVDDRNRIAEMRSHFQESDVRKRRKQLCEEHDDIQRGVQVCVCVCVCDINV